jgi:hypothetical protein
MPPRRLRVYGRIGVDSSLLLKRGTNMPQGHGLQPCSVAGWCRDVWVYFGWWLWMVAGLLSSLLRAKGPFLALSRFL